MRWRRNYLVIAVVLTVLDAVVTVDYGTAVWSAWSGDILAHGLLILFAAMGATSLANVWVQAGLNLRAGSEYAMLRRRTVLIPTEMRGQGDV